MANDVFKIRQGDRLPRFTTIASDAAGTIDFTRFRTIEFSMTNKDGSITRGGPASGDRLGNLVYDWAVGDTDTAGLWSGCFRAWDENGKPQTFPTEGELVVFVIKCKSFG